MNNLFQLSNFQNTKTYCNKNNIQNIIYKKGVKNEGIANKKQWSINRQINCKKNIIYIL